jgi:hypothetical protein
MKPFGLVLVLAISAGAASAQTRQQTTSMSCAAAASLVQSRGAIVLGTGGDTFERFVRDASFCFRGQTTRPTFVPALDNRQCMVGYHCFDENPKDR